MTTATQPPNPQSDEVCVNIEPNERGGYSLVAAGIISTVPVGNYATWHDAKRTADHSGLTVLNEPC